MRRQPHLDLESRLEGLIRYPYGCIEQTVSAAFPQLYFKDLVDLPPGDAANLEFKADAHINTAIRRMRRFQLADGSFGFWPGGRRPSVWGSLYVGHFLLEARSLGYHVPPDMMTRWLQYQRSQALLTRDPLVVRVKRAYLLALATLLVPLLMVTWVIS